MLGYVEVMKPLRGYTRHHDVETEAVHVLKIVKGMVFKLKGVWYESHGKPFRKNGMLNLNCEPLGVRGEERTKVKRQGRYETKAMKAWQKEKNK